MVKEDCQNDYVKRVYMVVKTSTEKSGGPGLIPSLACNALLCQTTLAWNLTIFGGFAKDRLARLSATGASDGRHPDAVVGESVEAVQLQHLTFRFLGLQFSRSL